VDTERFSPNTLQGRLLLLDATFEMEGDKLLTKVVAKTEL